MTAAKERLDQLLVSRELAPSREKAQAMILAGVVLVDDQPAGKAGVKVRTDANIRIRGDASRFVGRGGDKLDGALKHFGLDLKGLTAIDVGASTGGFTQCMLEYGAAKVYAVDVGFNQLDDLLRRDPRVVVMEQTHAKDLTPEMFAPLPSFAAIDVSFISVRKVLDFVIPILIRPFTIIALVKPQFEVGKEQVGKGGVVREEALQHAAVEDVRAHGEAAGLKFLGSVPSVLKGAKKGNQEYFVLFGV